jgi:hypothetical protein
MIEMNANSNVALSVTDVQDRLKARHSSHYLDLYNVMKGVTLAVAGASLLEISAHHWPRGRLLLWAVALTGAVLTYYGPTAGAALLNGRLSLPDILFPMLLSIAELILIYRPGQDIGPGAEWIPTDWFAFLAAWCVSCSFVIFFVSRGLGSSNHTDALRTIVTVYRKGLRNDCQKALAAGGLSLAIFLGWHLHFAPDGHSEKVAAVIVLFAFILGGLDSQRRASNKINDHLQDARASEAGENGHRRRTARAPGFLTWLLLLFWVGRARDHGEH